MSGTKSRYLVLQSGEVFEGKAFGADRQTVGELVFATGMVGYIETLTDPSYYGQIVMQTFPMIGNYGIISEDFEGRPALFGYVVREWCEQPSNFRCEQSLDEFLKANGVPGIYGVDTREITNIIRERGVVNALICDCPPKELSAIEGYSVKNAVEAVSTDRALHFPAEGEEKYRVALIDYGKKQNIVRSLTKRGCSVDVLPHSVSAEQVMAMGVNGVMLSNGPGDPQENARAIEQIESLLSRVPIFGICLGHQLTALADGGKTVKLKYGHRGGNQPCRQLATGRCFITSQNHGYAVEGGSTRHGRESFVNANDGTNEGMDYPSLHAFTVQFHPEACSGPRDAEFLFDKFLKLMEDFKNASL